MHGANRRFKFVLTIYTRILANKVQMKYNKDRFEANHTYNEGQIEWFKAGSALKLIKAQAAS
jgi:hypothetical protein